MVVPERGRRPPSLFSFLPSSLSLHDTYFSQTLHFHADWNHSVVCSIILATFYRNRDFLQKTMEIHRNHRPKLCFLPEKERNPQTTTSAGRGWSLYTCG